MINEKLFSNVSFIFTDFLFDIGFQNKYPDQNSQFRYFSGIRDFSLKADIDYFLSPKHTIKAGLNAGADIIEIDIRQTKDQHIVLNHDSDLRRCFGINLSVKNNTLRH